MPYMPMSPPTRSAPCPLPPNIPTRSAPCPLPPNILTRSAPCTLPPNIRCNNIGASGAQCLSALTHLTALHIYGNYLQAAGAAALSGFTHLQVRAGALLVALRVFV